MRVILFQIYLTHVNGFRICIQTLTLITEHVVDKLINCKRTSETLSKQWYYFTE